MKSSLGMNLPAEIEDETEEPSLAFGGQAVIEGIMLRSKKNMVVCVRTAKDEILTKTEKIASLSEKYTILRLPLLRGVIALFETLYLGVKSLYFSVNATLTEEEKLTNKEMAITLISALALTIFLFSVLPFLLTTLLPFGGIAFNLVEGVVRLSVFLLYLAAISFFGEFTRLLQYHGAEHMTINAYEAGVPLNVTNVKKYSRFHARCGTAFILITALTGVLFFSIMPDTGYFERLTYRVLLVPVIGAVSYELLKISDRYKESRIVKALLAPGLGLQFLTTREPDEEMLAVALKAVEKISTLQGPR
jgi:uncharacterized protein YqhQ